VEDTESGLHDEAGNLKVALVTGASRGIGRAIALALAKAGTRIIIHYGRSASEADSLRKQIQAVGGLAETVAADVASPDGVAELAQQVRELAGDRLDVLVANAGISRAASIEDDTVQDFDSLFATNVRAPFFLVQQLLPLLGEGSSVVLVSSLAARFAFVGPPGSLSLPGYASTKGALDTLVKHFGALLGPRGIRTIALAPGVIETDMSNLTKTEAGRDLALGMQALKRIGPPSDIVDVIAFVAADAARWITGAILPVDRGSKL